MGHYFLDTQYNVFLSLEAREYYWQGAYTYGTVTAAASLLMGRVGLVSVRVAVDNLDATLLGEGQLHRLTGRGSQLRSVIDI